MSEDKNVVVMDQKNDNFEEHEVITHDGPNIKFVGEQLATCSNQYEQNRTRAQILTLYRTKAGKYICSTVNTTQWQSESWEYQSCVCDSHEEIIEFFGYSDLAKQIYEDAKIDACTRID